MPADGGGRGAHARCGRAIDGVVLERARHRATFLPQVWEQLPEPRAFMRALKRKAGLAERLLERRRARCRATRSDKFVEDEPRVDVVDFPGTLVAASSTTGASSATCARATAACTRASAARASCASARTTRWCSRPTAARPGSASIRSRRSRSTTSIRARSCSRSARRAATSPASSARTGTSRSRARWTRSWTRRRPAAIARRGACARLQRASRSRTTIPVIFAEYAMDTADACHARGIATVAVTAGYIGDRRAARVLRQDGRGQRRPQGVHRRVLREALRRAARAGARHAALPRPRDATCGPRSRRC